MSMKKYLLMPLVFAICGIFCAKAQTQPVRFAFMTDLHWSASLTSSQAALHACVNDINSRNDIDFVVVGGDLTDFGSDSEIADVKAVLDRLRPKVYVVAGNHDAKWSESGCNTFEKVFGYSHFEFEEGGWRFLGCNSGPDMRMAPALLPRESMLWLEGLEEDRKSIFFNHYPQDSSVLNYFDVTRQLKEKDVRFEIGGHWHVNTVLDYGGIPAVLGRSSQSTATAAPGYNVFTLLNDHISVSEVRIYSEACSVELSPWYEHDLSRVDDRTVYDEHGLPDDYPWMRYDVNDSYPQVHSVWSFQEDANIAGGFAHKGSVAYYVTTEGAVKAVSLKDGSELWQYMLPGKAYSTPAISGRFLVVGCAGGGVYALDSRKGTLLWKKDTEKSVLGSPVIYKNKVYIGGSDGRFRALNLKDGSSIWTFTDVEGFIECRPFVDDTQVVFGSWSGRMYSLDPDDGHLQWTWKCEKSSRMYSPAACWPVKAAGRIFFANPDRFVYALDASTGRELARFEGARESVGISRDGRTIYSKSMFHHTLAIDAASLAVKWNEENGTGYEISPTAIIEIAGMVLIPTDKGNVIAMSAQDGSILWAHKISIALVNPLTVWEDNASVLILSSTMDGRVELMRLAKTF